MNGDVLLTCPSCGTELGAGLLSCPSCRRLIHGETLKRLAGEAEAAERAGDIATASARWQDALALLPRDARQFDVITRRVAELGERMVRTPGAKTAAPRPAWTKAAGVAGVGLLALWKFKFILVFLLTKAKVLLLGLTKLSTLGSMLLAFSVYWQMWGWAFAAGLLLSIYVHEMGHVVWMRHYGIPASAPMFIPGIGAFVRGRQYPGTPAIDARIGLAGPLWGLGAALAAWGIYAATGAPIWAAIARVGAWINLFNLLPVWHLDGGWAFNALPKKDRWLAAGLLGATWFFTEEPLLVLLGLAAVFRAFSGTAPEKRDVPVLAWYAGLAVALALLSGMPVPEAAQVLRR